MRHSWKQLTNDVQRCRRKACRLKRKRYEGLSFNTGRVRTFVDYRWPEADGDWFLSARQPTCRG